MGDISLNAYLDASGYGTAFRQDHLYPMAAAIWSTPAAEIGEYPARAFVRFCENHGLLKLTDRPLWRTLADGSRAYIEKLAKAIPEILTNTPILAVRRYQDCAEVVSAGGETRRFDHVVIATHADQALKMLADPTPEEDRLLGAFGYCANERSAPFRRNADAAPTPRLVELELSVERSREQQKVVRQLLDESSSMSAKRKADVFDPECASANPQRFNPVRD